jgi:hypothetical protein
MDEEKELRQKQLDDLEGAAQVVVNYVAHVLGLVKLFWPKADVSRLADGVAADCSGERFVEYLQEVEPVAQKNS